MVLLAHSHRELVHNAAVHPHKLVFGALRHQGHLCPVVSQLEHIVQRKGGEDFDGSGGGKPGSVGDGARVEQLQAGRLKTFCPELLDHSQGIIHPGAALPFAVQIIQMCMFLVVKIHGGKLQNIVLGFAHGQIGPVAQSTGKHQASVVVGVFPDEVHPAWAEKHLYLLLACAVHLFKRCEQSHPFHISVNFDPRTYGKFFKLPKALGEISHSVPFSVLSPTLT